MAASRSWWPGAASWGMSVLRCSLGRSVSPSPWLGLFWTPWVLWCWFSELPASKGDPHRSPSSGSSASTISELFPHVKGDSGFQILNPILSALTDYSEERCWRGILGYFIALDICATSYKNTDYECCLSCSFQNRLKRAHGSISPWMKSYIKTLLPYFFFLFPSFLLWFYSVCFFGLQIVLFVFITKLQNKILIIQFVQKAIKRLNVFLLLAG